ncbi:hypothetical protein ACHAW6_010119 [Cyclotella cf. meneghiniana]
MSSSTNENIHPNRSNSAGAAKGHPLGGSDTAMNRHSSSHANRRSAPSAATVATLSSNVFLIERDLQRCHATISELSDDLLQRDVTLAKLHHLRAQDSAKIGELQEEIKQFRADKLRQSDNALAMLHRLRVQAMHHRLRVQDSAKIGELREEIKQFRDDNVAELHLYHRALAKIKENLTFCQEVIEESEKWDAIPSGDKLLQRDDDHAKLSSKIACPWATISELQEENKHSHAECQASDARNAILCNRIGDIEAENAKLKEFLRTIRGELIDISKKYAALLSGSPAEPEQAAVANQEGGKQTAPVKNDTATAENRPLNSLVPMAIPMLERSSDANIPTTDHRNEKCDDKATIAELRQEIRELELQQIRFANCLHKEQEKNKALNKQLECHAAAPRDGHASNIVPTEQLNWSALCMREALQLRDQKLASAQTVATTKKHQSK